MDQELIRQRELFKKRALAQPTVEKRKSKPSADNDKPSKKPKLSKPRESSSASSFDYKSAQATSHSKFGILSKIVNYMKSRHQQNDMYPLDIDEILDETKQLDIGNKNKHWLTTEALPSNDKIKVPVYIFSQNLTFFFQFKTDCYFTEKAHFKQT